LRKIEKSGFLLISSCLNRAKWAGGKLVAGTTRGSFHKSAAKHDFCYFDRPACIYICTKSVYKQLLGVGAHYGVTVSQHLFGEDTLVLSQQNEVAERC